MQFKIICWRHVHPFGVSNGVLDFFGVIPLVYTDSCARDGLSMTLVLVNALIFPDWKHCTVECFRIGAYGVCEATIG